MAKCTTCGSEQHPTSGHGKNFSTYKYPARAKALQSAKKGKKKPEYKSGWEQHIAEQREGRKIEREERGMQ